MQNHPSDQGADVRERIVWKPRYCGWSCGWRRALLTRSGVLHTSRELLGQARDICCLGKMLVPSVCVPRERLRVNDKFLPLDTSNEGEFLIHRRGRDLLHLLLNLSPPGRFAFRRKRGDDGWVGGLLDRSLGVDML